MTVRRLGLALTLAGVAACAADAPERPNLLLVTFDTTRADHLPAYGYAHVETPTLSRMARAGIRYARCYSPVPLTLPAHASLMTGLYPFRHGLRDNGTHRLDPALPSLARTLRAEGYATGAVVAAFVLDSRFGLAEGFDYYEDDLSAADERSRFHFAERPAAAVTDAALDWLADAADRPFFLWVHYFDPHSPYAAPGSGSGAEIAAPYDLEIAHADRELGRLLAHIDSIGTSTGRPTLQVFTADHGEALWEHGEPTHGFFVYQETLHVPLIVVLPSGAGSGTLIETPVSLVDLFPSILSWLGVPVPQHIDGVPVPTEPVEGPDPGEARALYFETQVPESYYGWSPLRGVVMDGGKYIDAPRPELYDLRADPEEAQNLLPESAQLAESHRQALASLTANAGLPAATPVELDAEDARRLRALGYLVSRASPSDSAADPKDRVHLHRRVLEAQASIDTGDAASAVETLSRVLHVDPDNRRSLFLLLDLLNDPELRVPVADLLERRMEAALPSPLDLRVPRGVGAVWSVEQRWLRAERALRVALDAAPEDGRANFLLSRVLLAQGRPPEQATVHAERAYRADPADPHYAGMLAQILGALGQRERAQQLYERVLEASPDDALALNNSAWLDYEADAQLQRALRRSERALLLAPERPEFRHTYGCLLARLGRDVDARRALRGASSASCPH